MERNTKRELAVGIAVVIAFSIVTSVISVFTSRYVYKTETVPVLQEYEKKEMSNKISEIQKLSEYKGEVQEIKDLYLKGLLTEEKASQEFREVLLKAEEISPGFNDDVKFEIDCWTEDVGPDSEVTANIISNELDELIYDLINEN